MNRLFKLIWILKLPLWQRICKRGIGHCFIINIYTIIFLPFISYYVYGVKRSSSGPILFKQERIGYNGSLLILLNSVRCILILKKTGHNYPVNMMKE
jgi:lipopolysaccharide/colanic/teichoic acid biosynthesis glycosyltransferase